MNKIINLIGISTLFLFASCNNEDIDQSVDKHDTQSVQEAKMYTPVVQGVFGVLTDVNPEPTTKAGVIEDNTMAYSAGEKFYWHNGDKVKLLFFDNDSPSSSPIELIYTAVVPDNTKPSSCTFTTVGSVLAGNYTVYGLHPADGWSYDDDTGNYTATISTPGGEQYFLVNDVSSAYLGRNMFMKAKAEGVVIGSEGPNSINLSYRHLGAVLRFHLRKTITNPDPAYTTLHRLEFGFNDFNAAFYPASAHLDGGIDGNSLVAGLTKYYYLPIVMDTGLNGLDFDFFITIIPFGGFNGSDKVSVKGYFNDLSGNPVLGPLSQDFPIADNPTILQNGFEAGKSYFISAVSIP